MHSETFHLRIPIPSALNFTTDLKQMKYSDVAASDCTENHHNKDMKLEGNKGKRWCVSFRGVGGGEPSVSREKADTTDHGKVQLACDHEDLDIKLVNLDYILAMKWLIFSETILCSRQIVNVVRYHFLSSTQLP